MRGGSRVATAASKVAARPVIARRHAAATQASSQLAVAPRTTGPTTGHTATETYSADDDAPWRESHAPRAARARAFQGRGRPSTSTAKVSRRPAAMRMRAGEGAVTSASSPRTSGVSGSSR